MFDRGLKIITSLVFCGVVMYAATAHGSTSPQVEYNPTIAECTLARDRLLHLYRQTLNLAGVSQRLEGTCDVELGFRTVADFKSFVEARKTQGFDPTHDYIERDGGRVVQIFISLEVIGEIIPNPSVGTRPGN